MSYTSSRLAFVCAPKLLLLWIFLHGRHDERVRSPLHKQYSLFTIRDYKYYTICICLIGGVSLMSTFTKLCCSHLILSRSIVALVLFVSNIAVVIWVVSTGANLRKIRRRKLQIKNCTLKVFFSKNAWNSTILVINTLFGTYPKLWKQDVWMQRCQPVIRLLLRKVKLHKTYSIS